MDAEFFRTEITNSWTPDTLRHYLFQESPHKDFWQKYDATDGISVSAGPAPHTAFLHSPFLVTFTFNKEMEQNEIHRVTQQRRAFADDPANIWIVERGYRPTYLLAYLKSEVARGVETDLILNLWEDTEAPHHAQETWDEIFTHESFDPAHLDRRAIPAGTFPIYRGGDYAGRSWTLDQQIGTWFAHRFGTERLQTAMITAEDVLFYTNGRQEQEVVLNVQGLFKIYGDAYPPDV